MEGRLAKEEGTQMNAKAANERECRVLVAKAGQLGFPVWTESRMAPHGA